MLNRWLLEGNYGGSTPVWNTIISNPTEWVHPQNEVSSEITSTSKKYDLVDGSQARVSKTIKYIKDDIILSYSVFSTNESYTYNYHATPVTYTVKEILNDLLINSVSVRIRYQEYISSAWVTKETFSGYFRKISKVYRMLRTPQLYVVDVILERFPVDGTSNY